jgi:succinoglycan biosynthesis protein ExoA
MQTRFSGRISAPSLVPPAFLVYLLTLTLVAHPVYRLPLIGYVLLAFASALGAAVSSVPPFAAIFLPILFPLFHLAYGAGMITGLLFPKPVSEGGEVRLRKAASLLPNDASPDASP